MTGLPVWGYDDDMKLEAKVMTWFDIIIGGSHLRSQDTLRMIDLEVVPQPVARFVTDTTAWFVALVGNPGAFFEHI